MFSPFHPELPTWAMDAGADVCVTSVHKMGSGLEQGSVFHLQGDRVTAPTLHRRINAQLTQADDETTTERLLDGLRDLVSHADELPRAPDIRVPDPGGLRLRQVTLPRDAFFGEVAQVPADRAVGRICAEMLTPYPPGIPVALPGEMLDQAVVEYLRTGAEAGMLIPDAADGSAGSIRVSVHDVGAD